MSDGPGVARAEDVMVEPRNVSPEEGAGDHAGQDESEDLEQDLELDAEAQAMMDDLDSSQAEVKRMLAAQKQQTEELGGMRDNLASELDELKQEAWKLEMYGELEVLKGQLASLQGLESDLDAAEAILDATEPGASPDRALAPPSSSSAAVALGGDDDEEEFDVESITEMQSKLDDELAEMFAQLKAIKEEAATASARKVLLEAELKALLDDEEGEILGLEGEYDTKATTDTQ